MCRYVFASIETQNYVNEMLSELVCQDNFGTLTGKQNKLQGFALIVIEIIANKKLK